LDGLAIVDVGTLHGRLVYFTIKWYILCRFGFYFFGFGILCREKSGNPAVDVASSVKSGFITYTGIK
jgi:hypothetical protein